MTFTQVGIELFLWISAHSLVWATSHPATSAPFRGGYCPIRRVRDSPGLSAAGVRFLAVLCPLWDWPALARGLLDASRPQRGCHVPHRQETLGELASRRREPGTISGEPLISPDPHSSKDSHRHTRPLLHNDASTKASQMFNSTPTFPRRDFDCGCLLSLCFYDLLATPWLPTTPRPYGNGPLVLAQSDFTSF